MTPVETALVTLISIWSIIFVVVGIFLIVLLISVKKALDKVNKILQTTENVTEGVGVPLRIIADKIANFFSKKKSK